MLLEQLEKIYDRYQYIEEKLSDPEVIGDRKAFAKTHKEYKGLEEIVQAYKRYKDLMGNINTAESMLHEEDPEMREMARIELDELLPERKQLEERIKFLLVPKDPDDSKDVIFEIRAGTGGDEASIFAGDLYRMYTKFFDTKGFRYETILANEGTVGGFNKVVLEVTGQEVYGTLKFESGAHRVQRVPKTETQGRVHTSAATVVVMPKFEEEDINIRKEDLRIDTYRASGAGGQHVNKTESAVRITHIPTGIVSESQDSRSQIKNREIALQRLFMKIKTDQRNRELSEQAAQRKSLVGSGDRSNKIRTYNYPQNRVTDHRINLTLYSLDKIMDGDINDIIKALQVAENAAKMKEGTTTQ